MGKKVVVGVDLGGTSLFAAVIDKHGRVLGESKRKTRPALGAVGVSGRIVKTVKRAIKAADLKKKDVLGVGIGVPGPLDPATGIVVRCPNLGSTWDSFPLAQTLEKELRLPVTIDNDVNVGAVGEHTYGAGRDVRDMVAIFVGTGLGGGVIINDQLYGGSRNSAGEVGHMVLLADGPACSCQEQGHAEALASRSAIERWIREAVEQGRPSIVPDLMEQSGRDLMTSSIIAKACTSGDDVTVEAVQKAQHYLGLLISACVNLLDPEAVVIGGGVLEKMGDAYLEPVRQVAQQHYINKQQADRVRIIRAELGDYSGALGAAVLARQRLG